MRILLFCFPFIINMLFGGMFFITAYRFSLAHAPGWVVGATTAAWAILYSIGSMAAGRLVNGKNAPRLLNIGCFLLFASFCGFLIFDGLCMQFFWITLSGIGGACYCTPFQLIMKMVEPDQAGGGAAHAAGMYTGAWSSGLATGPLIFGLFSYRTGFAINAVLSLLLWFGAVGLAKYAKQRAAPSRQKTADADALPSRHHDRAPIGWILAGAGVFAVSILRVMWPCRGAELLIPKSDIGISLAILSYEQAAIGFFLSGNCKWKDHPRFAFLAGLAGTAALLLYALAPGQVGIFYLAAILFGFYSGHFFFLLVYFAIEDTSRAARNTGISEFLVGICSMAAPMLGGMLAAPGAAGRAFYPAIALTALTTVFIAWILKKKLFWAREA